MDPGHIMQVGMGFWPSKTLLSAVELGVFTELGCANCQRRELGERLGLHPRGIVATSSTRLVALGFLERDGDGADAALLATRRTARLFLDRNQPALRRRHPGDGQRAPLSLLGRSHRGAADRRSRRTRSSTTGRPMFDELYGDPARLEQFMHAMAGISRRQLPGAGREVRLLAATRRCATSAARPGSCRDRRRAAPPAPALHELRPAGGRADRGARTSRRPGSPIG